MQTGPIVNRTIFRSVLLCLFLVPHPVDAVLVTLNFGAGYSDPTAFSDPDLPTATTLGQARTQVAQAAAAHVDSFFAPSFGGESWTFDMTWASQGPGVLGGGAVDSFIGGGDFTGGDANFSYPKALANHVAGSMVYSGFAGSVEMNTDITNWEFSTTSTPATGLESMYTTMVHEIAHALGGFNGTIMGDGSYQGADYPNGGPGDANLPSVFDKFIVQDATTQTPVTSMSQAVRAAAITSDNLFFNGPLAQAANTIPGANTPAKLNAPGTFDAGSSVYHLDATLYDSTGDLMLPAASPNVPELLFLSPLDVAAYYDMGFTPIPEPSAFACLSLLFVAVGGWSFTKKFVAA